ncbi:MAG: DEAD/DEAH box helicase [Treponema sp.]|nr:DEAD/DEAH box helicase [Treponema sp.]
MGAENFAELGIDPFFIKRLAERDIKVPTEIQKRVIPRLSAGENLIFCSATGTGKTFAYLLPVIQNFLFPPPAGEEREQPDAAGRGKTGAGLRVLICAPTYELCSQIKHEADFLLAGAAPLKTGLIIGSANMGRQIEGLKRDRPALIVGNPGRLLRIAQMGKLKLNQVRALVLDEGDRLVSEELLEETRRFTAMLGQDRLSLACSATMTQKSRERLLPLLGSRAAYEETADPEVLGERIRHWALYSEERRKIGTLRSFIAAAEVKKALVFIGPGGRVGNIVSQLQYHHMPAAGLYSDMDKQKRKAALENFRSGRTGILVSSDLAARGLDIPGISHVISLDTGEDPQVYQHRAGRTGRAGRQGVMVSIGDEEELRQLARLEKKLGITVYPKVLYEGKVLDPQP